MFRYLKRCFLFILNIGEMLGVIVIGGKENKKNKSRIFFFVFFVSEILGL